MPKRQPFCVCLVAVIIFFNLFVPISVFAKETIIYTEGFETDNGGYSFDGNAQWEWGTPTSPDGPAFANSGQNCWGTFPTTTVGLFEGNLYSPSINIPPLGADQLALVSFYAYIDIYIEAIRTEGDIYISADGMQTWQLLARLYDEMAGGWQRYQFDVSEYAGKNVNLRFRAYRTETVPGLFIDDVALTVKDVPSPTVLLSLEAQEDTAANASCPWVYPWDGAGFVRDNDIYSVGRYPQGEMRDYYLLQKPLVAQDSHYTVEIREVESEDSWTDLLGLLAVDHPPEVSAAPDGSGNILAYRPAELVKPIAAVSGTGSDVLSSINAKENIGFKAYSEDYIDLDFGSVDVSTGSRVLLRVKGFIAGEGVAKPFTGPPAILIQVRDHNGDLQEIGRLSPRFDWSEGVFNLSPYLPDLSGQLRIRLTSISHDVKYHEIDFVALATGPPPAVTVTELPMLTATFGATDVLSSLSASDNDYVQLTSGNKFTASFTAVAQAPGLTRDFILVSEGYYIPKNSTYFIYAWDGSQWLQRDSYSFTAIDSQRDFNLSAYLPDPDGEYKVRIWQDYSNFAASIDYVGLRIGSLDGNLVTATDLRNNNSIIDVVRDSDDSRFEYPLNPITKQPRNRWSEYGWTLLSETFILSFSTDSNGRLTGNTSQSLSYGADATAVTAVPDNGYHFVNWTGINGFVTSTNNPLTVTNVTSDMTITANFANSPPIAGDLSLTTAENQALSLTLSGSDPEESTLTYASGNPEHGTLSGTPPTLIYTPASGYVGTDSFTFIVNDGTNSSTAATVSIIVTQVTRELTFAAGNGGAIAGPSPQTINWNGQGVAVSAVPDSGYHFVNWTGSNGFVTSTNNPLTVTNVTANMTITANFANSPPIASDQSLTTAENQALSLTLSGSDPEESTLIYVSGSPEHGTLSGTPPTLIYTPASGYVGTDSFTFIVNDGTNSSTAATVSIIVTQVTRELTFAAGNGGAIAGPSPQTINWNGQGVAVSAVPDSGYHFVNWTGSNGFVTSTNNPLTVTNVTSNMTITANFANSPPIASDQSLTTAENQALSLTLSGSDPEESTLTYVAGSPEHGTLSGTPPTLIYTPASGYVGTDSFTFIVSDGTNSSTAATVSIIVTQVTRELTFAAGNGGVIAGPSPQTINWNGQGVAVSAVPDSGYHFVNWTAPGGFVSTANPLIVGNVIADLTYTANFVITPISGACGSSNTGTFMVVPSTNLCSVGAASAVTGSGHPWSWSCSGVNAGIAANCTATIQSWLVTPLAGNNGTLSPATPQSVDHDATTSFTITPSSGYQIASVTGCNGIIAGKTYTTGAVTGSCTVAVNFSPIIPHDGIVTMGGTFPTIVDALAVLQHAVGRTPLNSTLQIHADVAPLAPDGKPMGNGVVDFADVIIILRRVINADSW